MCQSVRVNEQESYGKGVRKCLREREREEKRVGDVEHGSVIVIVLECNRGERDGVCMSERWREGDGK